jgi:hypothetical protein
MPYSGRTCKEFESQLREPKHSIGNVTLCQLHFGFWFGLYDKTKMVMTFERQGRN